MSGVEATMAVAGGESDGWRYGVTDGGSAAPRRVGGGLGE
jgi:hypothetical protein